jgi:hypothetical protein
LAKPAVPAAAEPHASTSGTHSRLVTNSQSEGADDTVAELLCLLSADNSVERLDDRLEDLALLRRIQRFRGFVTAIPEPGERDFGALGECVGGVLCESSASSG